MVADTLSSALKGESEDAGTGTLWIVGVVITVFIIVGTAIVLTCCIDGKQHVYRRDSSKGQKDELDAAVPVSKLKKVLLVITKLFFRGDIVERRATNIKAIIVLVALAVFYVLLCVLVVSYAAMTVNSVNNNRFEELPVCLP